MWVWNRTRVDGVNESGDALTTAPSGIWLLTVSDEAIAGVASRLAQTHPDLSEVTAFHCAGRYDVELLAPLASKGCKIGVFHPIQALLGEPEDVQNAWCVVSGTSDVHTVAQKLADWIGGRYVERTGTDAATYHLAAVLTANFVSTLLHTGVGTDGMCWDRLSLREIDVAFPINWNHRQSIVPNASRVLTGPFARKDMAAIGHHAERIHTHAPHALETYQSLAELTARMMSWSESEQVQLNMLFNHLSDGH